MEKFPVIFPVRLTVLLIRDTQLGNGMEGTQGTLILIHDIHVGPRCWGKIVQIVLSESTYLHSSPGVAIALSQQLSSLCISSKAISISQK